MRNKTRLESTRVASRGPSLTTESLFPPQTARVQVFDGPGKTFRLIHLPVPSVLGEGEVLASIELATICSSDLHTTLGRRDTPLPCVLGHEAVGRVLQVGPGRPHLKAGDRITWTLTDSCDRCPACVEYGLPEKCDALFKYGHAALSDGCGLNGCYATHIVLHRGTYIATVPPSLLDIVVAPANCALATMVNVVSRLPKDCDSVVIQGAGLLGLYGCALLRERGLRHIFCTDVDEGRLVNVPLFGGIPIRTVSAGCESEREKILEAAPNGVDALIEVAGDSSVVPEGIQLLRVGGLYLLAGMVHRETPLQLTGEQIIRKCLTLQGIHNYAPCHLDQALEFLERTAGRYPCETLVSPPFKLEDLEAALETALSLKWLRVAVKPTKS